MSAVANRANAEVTINFTTKVIETTDGKRYIKIPEFKEHHVSYKSRYILNRQQAVNCANRFRKVVWGSQFALTDEMCHYLELTPGDFMANIEMVVSSKRIADAQRFSEPFADANLRGKAYDQVRNNTILIAIGKLGFDS